MQEEHSSHRLQFPLYLNTEKSQAKHEEGSQIFSLLYFF